MHSSTARMFCRFIVVSAILASASGCVHVRNGLYNFVEDAGDIVRLDVSTSWGTGMGAHVMVTKFVQLKSYSYEDVYRVGLGNRMISTSKEDRQDFWIGPVTIGDVKMRAEGTPVLQYGMTGKLLGMADNARHDRKSFMAWGAKKTWEAKMPFGAFMEWAGETSDEVGVGFHLFVVGARIGVRPLEILDFLTAPFGLDICNDNLSVKQRQAMQRAIEALEKAKKEQEKKPPEEETEEKQAEP
jgi:hypothetical protein